MTVHVRRYLLREPLDWDDSCEHQIGAMTRFWNNLVEIDRRARQEYLSVLRQDADFAAAEDVVKQLNDKSEALYTERKARRQKDPGLRALPGKARAATIPMPDIDEQIDELRTQIKAAFVVLKEKRKAAASRIDLRGGADIINLQQQIKEIKAENKGQRAIIKTKIKPLQDQISAILEDRPDTFPGVDQRRVVAIGDALEKSKVDGLWWCNYNAVLDSYNTGRAAAMKNGTELQFHSFRGDGRLKNQIQGGMSLDTLFSGRHSQVKVEPLDPKAFDKRVFRGDRDRAQNTTLTATIYTTPQGNIRKNASWPLWMSRPLVDAPIKEVVVTRRRIASRFRHAVVFTQVSPEAPSPPKGPPVAVNIGWKRVHGYGILVGTVFGKGDSEAESIYTGDVSEYPDMAERMIRDMDRIEELQSIRDKKHDEIAAHLRTLDWPTAPPELAELADKILRPHKRCPFGLTATLAIKWREFPDWSGRETVEAWRRFDKYLWEQVENLRDKALARRTDWYRKAAKKIAERAGTIIIPDTDFAALAKLETRPGRDDTPSPARRYRHLAAPSEFRKWLIIQANKRGIPIHVHEGKLSDRDTACQDMLTAFAAAHASDRAAKRTQQPLAAD